MRSRGVNPSGARLLLLAALASMSWCCQTSSAQLRIATYNTTATAGDGLDIVLKAIGEQLVNGVAKPVDVLALQEQVSMATTTQQIAERLNAIYGPGVYARGTVNGESFGAGRPGLIYNTRTVQLVQEVAIGRLGADRNARQTVRYRLRPVGYDHQADFFLYNSHFKGLAQENNPARRQAEARTNRANADSLGDGAAIIYAGDLNLYGSWEPAYQTLTAPGWGQALDPLDRPGSWHNSPGLRDVHTQSTTRRDGDNRAGGGMDDRFDFQLVSGELMDGKGLSYIGLGVPNSEIAPSEHSYHAFGNNGTHRMDDDIHSGIGAPADVLAALEQASDHLPVVADYQLPARMEVSVDPVPPRWIVGARADLTFTVENTAPVMAPIGADRLRYSALGSGAAHGAVIDADDAMDGGNRHGMSLDTDSVGHQRATLFVGTAGTDVPGATWQQTIDYDVVDHANGSFDPSADVDALSLDLGSLPRGSGPRTAPYRICSLAATRELTAGLDLQLSSAAGDVATLSISEPPAKVAPGACVEMWATVDTAVAGDFSSIWTFATRDQPIPGATAGDDLLLRLKATVTGSNLLQPGDADQNLQFDQLDLVRVLVAGKYLTGRPATWGEGDWDGAPGGQVEDPPLGDGLFNQRDIIAALTANHYLEGQVDRSVAGWATQGRRGTVHVPAPSTFVLLGLGLAGMASARGLRRTCSGFFSQTPGSKPAPSVVDRCARTLPLQVTKERAQWRWDGRCCF